MNEELVCKWCKGKVAGIKDQKSEKEFKISGLCQSCQDATFRAPKNKTYPSLELDEVQEFKKLVMEVYEIELSDEEARDQGSRLIQLFELQIQNKKSDFKKELKGGTT